MQDIYVVVLILWYFKVTFPPPGVWRHRDELRNDQECAGLGKKSVCVCIWDSSWGRVKWFFIFRCWLSYCVFREINVRIVHLFLPLLPGFLSLEPRLGPAAHLDHQAAAGKGEEDLGVNYGVCEEDGAEEVAVVVGGSLESEFLKQPLWQPSSGWDLVGCWTTQRRERFKKFCFHPHVLDSVHCSAQGRTDTITSPWISFDFWRVDGAENAL